MESQPSIEKLFEGILKGDRAAIARGITLLESSLAGDREKATDLIARCVPYSGKSIRIGITGVPGVGKSTFIESFGLQACEEGKKVCVLAIDPTSRLSGGSILGDKTRMQQLSVHPNAFIRPSPSAGAIGGVSWATREAILLFEAAGYEIVIVETVGVGQSETEVAEMTDFFLLLMLAGAGDELQGIKRGIMELCDAIYINKADGDNLEKARMAAQEYAAALHLFPPKENGWAPVADICSALTGQGIAEVWQTIYKFREFTGANGSFEEKRRQQEMYAFSKSLEQIAKAFLFSNTRNITFISEMESSVKNGTLNAWEAISRLRKQLQIT